MVNVKASQRVEIAAGDAKADRFRKRLLALERLVVALEEELCDESLSDEQKLQNIGERLAGATDGN